MAKIHAARWLWGEGKTVARCREKGSESWLVVWYAQWERVTCKRCRVWTEGY